MAFDKHDLPKQQDCNDTCDIFMYDPEKVQRRQTEMNRTDRIVPLFKALADETRLRIVYALSKENELCVCDVATIIDSSNATASHHLRLLKNMGLAKYRREGKMVFYSLQSPHIRHLIQEALHLQENTDDCGHCEWDEE